MEEHAPYSELRVSAQLPELPRWLRDLGSRQRFAKGAQILCCDEPTTHVYVVETGAVLILSPSADGRESRIVVVPCGSVVGEMEAIVGVPRIVYSARALYDCELLRVPAEAFLRWVRSDPAVCWALTALMAGKLYAASRQTTRYTATDALERIASLLLRYGVGRIRATRQDIAEACSVSVRTVNRCVRRLRDMGAIELSRGKIVVADAGLSALEQMVQNEP